MMNLTPEFLSSLPRQEREQLLRLLEEKRRRAARNSLEAYVTYIEVPGAPVSEDEDCEEFYPDTVEPAEHHKLLLEKLEGVANGAIKRLMILMPPGSAKSTYASVVFPTWYMGKFKRKNIIKATYGSDLAKKFGRKCRQVVRSDRFQKLFNTTLTGDNAAADDWSLTNGSTYMCGGILSGITGNRADGLIIDDPFKNREDADSETIRKKTIEEYRSSLKTRLKPSAWEILINTRWHEGDLSGEILPENYSGESGWVTARDGEQWYVLCLQAQCTRRDDPLGRSIGEYLWTDWFPVDWWEQTKRTQSTPSIRNWSALYQQVPAPDEGSYFKAEWVRWYDEIPAHLKKYGASDYAVTDNGGDWTVHLIGGVDPNDDLYLIERWRDRTDSLTWVDAKIDLIKQHRPTQWAVEKGQILKSLGPLIEKRQREEKAYCWLQEFASSADKEMRAQSIRGRMAQKKIYFPRGAPWAEEFVKELLQFPAGKYDDQVDAFGLLGRMLSQMVKGTEPPVKDGTLKGPTQMTIDQMIAAQRRKRLNAS